MKIALHFARNGLPTSAAKARLRFPIRVLRQ